MEKIENYDELYEFIDRIIDKNKDNNNYNLKSLKNVFENRVYTILIHEKNIKYLIKKININILMTMMRKLFYILKIKCSKK